MVAIQLSIGERMYSRNPFCIYNISESNLIMQFIWDFFHMLPYVDENKTANTAILKWYLFSIKISLWCQCEHLSSCINRKYTQLVSPPKTIMRNHGIAPDTTIGILTVICNGAVVLKLWNAKQM